MNLLFTGTGAADYETVFKCNCVNCTAIRTRGARNLRHYASLLINDAVLLDCGPTVPWRLAELEVLPAQVEALVLTHSHDDHLDIPAVKALVRARDNGLLPVYGNEACMARLEGMAGLALHQVRPLEAVEVSGMTLIPVAANHIIEEEETLNWVIRQQGQTMLYATDTGWPLPQTWGALQEHRFDGIVAEATFGMLKPEDHPGYMTYHMNWPAFLRLRDEMISTGIIAHETPFIATHLSQHHIAPHDDFVQNALYPVQIAYDGLTLNL